ncbi:MAG: hypothetical protein OEL79_01075, partial [Chromatiales bacterium]|nr:hypothetical protein [Chromatiales bacterium]
MIHKEQQLDYMSDPSIYYDRLRSEPWAIWLDSSHVAGTRHDILVAHPYITFTTRGTTTTISSADGVVISEEEPLKLISDALAIDETIVHNQPFSGGAVGYFGYGLNHSEKIEHTSEL